MTPPTGHRRLAGDGDGDVAARGGTSHPSPTPYTLSLLCFTETTTRPGFRDGHRLHAGPRPAGDEDDATPGTRDPALTVRPPLPNPVTPLSLSSTVKKKKTTGEGFTFEAPAEVPPASLLRRRPQIRPPKASPELRLRVLRPQSPSLSSPLFSLSAFDGSPVIDFTGTPPFGLFLLSGGSPAVDLNSDGPTFLRQLSFSRSLSSSRSF